MQAEIYSVMYRLVHKYGWNWGLTRGLINRRFGTNYTAVNSGFRRCGGLTFILIDPFQSQ